MTAPTPTDVASELRRRILAGEYRPGDVLPTAAALAVELGAPGESTVLTAWRRLREERLVDVRRRVGAVVLDPSGRDRLARSAMERDERGYYLQSGEARHQLIQHFGIQLGNASPNIARLLDVPVGAPVVIRDRVLGKPRQGKVRAVPMLLSTSYLPEWVANEVPAVRQADTGGGGIYDRIEEHYGGPLTWHEIVTAELATLKVSKRLSCARTSAILRMQRVTSTPDNRVVEVLDQRVAGDRYEIMHPIPRAESAAWPLDSH